MYHKNYTTICFILFTLSSVQTLPEYFSSMIGLEQLLNTENVLLTDIKQYLEFTKLHLEQLENEIIKIDAEHKLAVINREQYLTNPINAYRLIKRLHTDWETYTYQIKDYDMAQYFLNRMNGHREFLKFPSLRDFYGSTLALIRLQETYQLNVTTISDGILNGIKYGYHMTWQDCFTLGVNLYELKQYNSAGDWFIESVNRLSKEKYYQSPTAMDYIEIVAESLLELGNLEIAFNYSRNVLTIDPKRQKAQEIISRIQKTNRLQFHAAPDSDLYHLYHQTAEFKHYQNLCRGQVYLTTRQRSQLHCRYVSNNVPYRLLSPFKIEERHLEPLVWTIHDVIPDTKIPIIKELAVPIMQRSQVRGTSAYSGYTSEVRVSQQAWLSYENNSYLQIMLRDLHDATGLDISHCEQLQVANYGLAGHYEPHFDFFTTDVQIPDDRGNRIATAIFYLSDVEQGGATTFPYLNVSVVPQKGSMLFWHNLHFSTDRDYRTKHAGCPVLKGSKWIANIWVSELTQTFARPCQLQRDHESSLSFAIPT